MEIALSLENKGLKFETSSMKNPEDESEEESEEEEEEDSEEEGSNAEKKISMRLDGLSYNCSLYFRSHCAQVFNTTSQTNFFNKKVYFDLHPFYPIMVSIGEDQALTLWDIELDKQILVKHLGLTPTAIKFSTDGDLLVIGSDNGNVLILDSKITKNSHGKLNDS